MEIKINLDDNPKDRYASLREIYVLDFDDNYHRLESEPTTEFEREVRRIKRRYKNLNAFNKAVSTYNEWMDYLAEQHGGHEILKKKIKAGIINEYIPPKPRLKDNKSLKYLYKNDIVLSEIGNGKLFVIDDAIDDFIDEMDTDVDVSIEFVKKDKDVEEMTDEYLNSINYYKTVSKKSDIDFLDEYFRMKNSSRSKKKHKKKKKKHDKSGTISLRHLMSGEYLDMIRDTSEEDDDDRVMLIGGQFIKSGTSKDIDFYHQLNELGWNSYKLMKKMNYGKSVTKIFKESKKDKKKKKKQEKFLIDIMTDNGYDDFEQYSKEMLDFTSSNIFR